MKPLYSNLAFIKRTTLSGFYSASNLILIPRSSPIFSSFYQECCSSLSMICYCVIVLVVKLHYVSHTLSYSCGNLFKVASLISSLNACELIVTAGCFWELVHTQHMILGKHPASQGVKREQHLLGYFINKKIQCCLFV